MKKRLLEDTTEAAIAKARLASGAETQRTDHSSRGSLVGGQRVGRQAEGESKNLWKGREEADDLEATNKRLNLELEKAKKELEEAKWNRDSVVKELELAKSRLREVRDQAIAKESTAVKDSTVQVLASSREDETRILQDELKRLSDISI